MIWKKATSARSSRFGCQGGEERRSRPSGSERCTGAVDLAQDEVTTSECRSVAESFEKRHEGYGWIKVGRHRDDPSLSWEERFRILDQHHLKETQFLIEEV